MTRSEVREHLFKLLFRIEFNGPDDMPEQVRLYFEDSVGEEDMPVTGADVPDEQAEYIRDKYNHIVEVLPAIDLKIDAAANGWSVSRIAKVDLTILRLAVYEMIYDDDIPVGVAIDEAVELAKKFGQDSSFAFVNGVLASIAKQ